MLVLGTYEPIHEDVVHIRQTKANELQKLIFDFVGIIKTDSN